MAPSTQTRSKKNVTKSNSASVANPAASDLADAKKKNSELKKKLKETRAATENTRVLETDFTRRVANNNENGIITERLWIRGYKEGIKKAEASRVALREAHEKVKKEKRMEEKMVAKLKKEVSTLGSKRGVRAVNADKKKVAGLRKELIATQEALRKVQEQKNGESVPWKLCGICSNEYTEEALHCPRVLSCGHVICAHCIKTMIEGEEMECPYDREMIQICRDNVDKLPMDLLILQI